MCLCCIVECHYEALARPCRVGDPVRLCAFDVFMFFAASNHQVSFWPLSCHASDFPQSHPAGHSGLLWLKDACTSVEIPVM